MDPRLRPARPDDAEAIGRYHHRCWVIGYAHLVDPGALAALDPADHVRRWRQVLEADEHPTLVVERDGTPVGHVRVEGDVITNVYVDPAHWRGGLGRTLLAAGEELLVAAGHERGVLWTLVGNDRAVALYESEGWVLDGTRETHVSSAGLPVEEQRMVKDLRR